MSKYGEKPLIRQFTGYLKKPTLIPGFQEVWYMKIYNTVRLWALAFSLGIVVVLIGNYFLERVGYDHSEFAITQLFEEVSVFVFLLMILVWAPLSEEIAFRLGLKFSPVRLGIQITALLFFLILYFEVNLTPEFLFGEIGAWEELGIAGTMFILVSGLVSIFLNLGVIKKRVEGVFKKYFAYIFYTLAIVFAVMHMENYQENWFELWYLIPFLVMPQFLLALVASFVRIHYGFVWSVIVHALNNGIIGVLLLFLMPFLELEEMTHKIDETELMQHMSLSELLSVIGGSMFFMGIVVLIFLCIISLIWENFLYKRSKE